MYVPFGNSSIVIPGSVKSICAWAFYGTNLTDVTIDASPNDVILSTGAFPEGVTLVYTLGAVNGDDTFDSSGETIHDAVADGGTVTLTKDVVLSEPLDISSDVTINGDYTITADKGKDLKYLISVKPNVELTLGGGLTLNGRYVDVQEGSGVIVCEGTLNIEDSVTISKAIISSENSGMVRVTGTLNMTGGKICDNSVSGLIDSCPGVLVAEGGKFTMSGGEISGNSAPGGVGGGVCVVDPGVQTNTAENGTAFTMTGGIISGNSARAGGGIYSYTNGVSLEAGEISGNTAYVLGGGVYSEGNTLYYSTLHMENALITGNSATQGGGLWFCATGETTIYPAQGAAIFGNSAKDAGDDFAFTQSEGDHSAMLAGNVPGGGSVFWYKDGSIYLPSGSIYPGEGEGSDTLADNAPGGAVRANGGYSSLSASGF